MKAAVTALVLLFAGTAAADPVKDIGDVLDKVLWAAGPDTESRFAFTTYGVHPLGTEHPASLAMNNVETSHQVIGLASTGTDAFVATDITAMSACGRADCGKPIAWMHGALLFEMTADGWLPVVWHVAELVSTKAGKDR